MNFKATQLVVYLVGMIKDFSDIIAHNLLRFCLSVSKIQAKIGYKVHYHCTIFVGNQCKRRLPLVGLRFLTVQRKDCKKLGNFREQISCKLLRYLQYGVQNIAT